MTYPTDHGLMGIIPWQDHEKGVALGRRFYAAGGRVAEKPAETGVVLYDSEDGRGTLGDHPGWKHWPAGSRPFGGWKEFWPVIGTEGLYASGEGQTITGKPSGASGAAGQQGAFGAAGKGGDADAGKGKAPANSVRGDTYYANPGSADLPSSLGGSTYLGAPSYANGGDYYGGASLDYDPDRGVYVGAAQGVANDLFPQPTFGGFMPFAGPANSRGIRGAVNDPFPQAHFGIGGNGFDSSFGGGIVTVLVTKNNRSMFRNRKRAGPDGQVAAWMGKRGGSRSVLNSRANITGGSEANIIVTNPIRDDAYRPDVRFLSMAHALPETWPALPHNFHGIGAAGTEETRQDNIYLHTDPRMVAVNYAGSPAMGSWVCDLRKNDTADVSGPNPTVDGRAAPLQSMMRVIKMPAQFGGNGLAWQLTKSEQDDRNGLGLAYGVSIEKALTRTSDAPKNPGAGSVTVSETNPLGGGTNIAYDDLPGIESVYVTSAPADKSAPIVGLFAQEAGGPLSLGAASDQHNGATDADGHPIQSGHIGTDALFFRNKTEDGPLDFSNKPYPKVGKYPYNSAVILSWDDKAKHDWVGGQRRGLWKWWTTVPYVEQGKKPKKPKRPGTREPEDPGPPPREPGDTTPTPTTPNPPITGPAPWNPGNTFPTPGSGGGGTGGGSGGGSGGSGGGRGDGLGEGPFWWDGPDVSGAPPYMPRNQIVAVNDHSQGPADSHIMIPRSTGFASVLWRPQSTELGTVDYRFSSSPGEAASLADLNARPSVMRTEAFGKQASPWAYTYALKRDQGQVPTANGGVVLMPPEVDIMDFGTNFAPAGVTLSTSYFVAVPGVYFGAGLPNIAEGSIKTGVRWGADTSGNLIISAMSASSAATEAMRVLNSGAKLQATIGMAFTGITSSDVYIKKDSTGTLGVRLGDDSAYGGIHADNIVIDTGIDASTAAVTAKSVVLPEYGGTPAALANKVVLFADDDGGGTTALYARWPNAITGELARDFGAAFSQAHYMNAGTPEGAVTANPRALCWDSTNNVLYFKESGTGNTGWIGATAAVSGAQFLTLATDAALSSERVLTLARGLGGSDAGAGSTYTVSPTERFDGRLTRTSSTQCTLAGFGKGDVIEIGGKSLYIGELSSTTLDTTSNLINGSGADAGSAMGASTIYYVYVSSASASYAASSVRASTTAPSLLNGVYYLATSGNGAQWRYVGTVRTNSSTQFVDTVTERHVRNFYNRVPKIMETTPAYSNGNTVTSFTYGAGANWVKANGGTGSDLTFVGLPANESDIRMSAAMYVAASASGIAGIGLSTTGNAADTLWVSVFGNSVQGPMSVHGWHTPTVNALNTLSLMVLSAAGTATFSVDQIRSGATADPKTGTFFLLVEC